MSTKPLVWTAWNNGQHDRSGNGYGLKVPIADRDSYFEAAQDFAIVILPGSPKGIRVNTQKKSFWTKRCRELICKELGIWFLRDGIAPWPSGRPPKLRVTPLGGGRFKVEGIASE